MQVCAQFRYLRLENQCAVAKSDFSCVETPFLFGLCHCASVLQTQVPKLGTDLHLCLLYILILGTYSNFARKNNFLARRLLSAALLECWQQVCRVKITFTELPTNRFVSTTTKSMKCVVNYLPLRIRVCSRNTQPYLNHLEPKKPSQTGSNLIFLADPAGG